MRVYVSLRNASFLRNFESVVRVLLERGHHVILAIGTGEKAEGKHYLDGFVQSVPAENLEIAVPLSPSNQGGPTAGWLPSLLDYLLFLDPGFAQTPYSRLRRRQRIPDLARRLIRRYRLDAGWRRRAAMTWLRLADEALPADRGLVEHLKSYHPDVLLVSPLIGSYVEQVEEIRAAKMLRIPTVYAVHSWDNLSSKGSIRMRPEGVAVWNKAQERELLKLHRQPRRCITVTGAYNFDDWFALQPSVKRASFLRKVGLPADRPLILYLCSALHFWKARPEEDFVVEWIRTIRQCNDARVRDAAILVRPHPKRPREFADPGAFGGDPAVRVWPHKGELPAGTKRQRTFYHSLFHADAVVALNTTAMLEAAIVGRSVLTVLDKRFRASQERTFHFSYLTDRAAGLLRTAGDWPTHLRHLSETLGSGKDETRMRGFVENFVRPHGIDVASAPRLADFVEVVARRRRMEPLRGVWFRAVTAPWLKRMTERAELAERGINWKRVQTLEEWQMRRLFLDGLVAQGS